MFWREAPVVVINHVDLMKDTNQTWNNTAEFSHPDYVVVRRGGGLQLAATVSSDKFSAQDVRLELHRGARSRHTRGTRFDGVSTKKPRKYYQWPMEVSCHGIEGRRKNAVESSRHCFSRLRALTFSSFILSY